MCVCCVYIYIYIYIYIYTHIGVCVCVFFGCFVVVCRPKLNYLLFGVSFRVSSALLPVSVKKHSSEEEEDPWEDKLFEIQIRGGGHFLLPDCRASAQVKGVVFSQTPVRKGRVFFLQGGQLWVSLALLRKGRVFF